MPVFKGHSHAWCGPLSPSGRASKLLGYLVQKLLMRGTEALKAASSNGREASLLEQPEDPARGEGLLPAGGLARAVLSQLRVRADMLVSALGKHCWLWGGPCSVRGGLLAASAT